MIPLTQFSIKLDKKFHYGTSINSWSGNISTKGGYPRLISRPYGTGYPAKLLKRIKGEYEGNEVSKKAVIFSHGFGVRRDSRGMFTDIGNKLGDKYLLVKFDYVKINKNNSTTAFPYSTQVEILKKIISFVKDKFSPEEINIIAHSMGCLIIGLLTPDNIHKIILMAPPAVSPYEEMKEYFMKRKETVFDEKGLSKVKRSDGSLTFINSDFWPEVKKVKPRKLYTNLTKKSKVYIIRALEDEIINTKTYSNIKNIPKIKYYEIETNHNFEGEGRNKLIKIIKSLF